ncbi:2-oxoglutarate (2OG) and Fe(II)-dependent oxygenase superfamily protein [Striga asiatica]|uniref:2-oxoglutarate (2OG) and Fe(II)-dependent oxygenase superfamily protein n=1 Tax=Striga asiatica TaxID=4170 RepID=A0A5A7R317_STRAF|nr:2-oxoglutarate (2OG) and Fe(II)-dependent oxygenase superfamily protein [Striga asiatica]
MQIPVIDLGPYLELSGKEPNPDEDELDSEMRILCAEVSRTLRETGALLVKDPRCTAQDNDRFLDMMEKYFEMPVDFKRRQERPHLHYQVGVTPEGVEVPRSLVDQEMQEKLKALPAEFQPATPTGPDPKWRYMWRVGPRPLVTRFKEQNSEPVIPEGFPEWKDTMDLWGYKMISAVKAVAEMAAIGFGLQKDAFTSLMKQPLCFFRESHFDAQSSRGFFLESLLSSGKQVGLSRIVACFQPLGQQSKNSYIMHISPLNFDAFAVLFSIVVLIVYVCCLFPGHTLIKEYSLLFQGSHLLSPTGSDLKRHGQIGTVFAGYHYDISFLTIHGRSRFPGLNIWLRNGQKMEVKVPVGCLLIQTGKQLEWLTAGECTAGMHEVVVTDRTIEAIRLASEQNRSLWRVSSTLFAHVATDEVLRPLGHFADSPLAFKYPPICEGQFIEQELAIINLKANNGNS